MPHPCRRKQRGEITNPRYGIAVSAVVGGRFVLVDLIGQGGAGSVWRAWDERVGAYCAAKIVRAADAVALMRVVREQGLRPDHPHLLAPYAWIADDEQALIASELMAGGSLATLITDQGPLPARYALEIVLQLLDGLAYLHDQGVIHRDVKPANILLAATGQQAPHVRLGDFGIAMCRDEPRLTKTGWAVGTPGYVAPEVLLSGAPPSPAHDVYAAGLVAIQLLSGAEQPQPSRAERRPPCPMPDGLWRVLRKLCDPEPRNRPATASMAHALVRGVIEDIPVRLPALTADGDPVEVFDVLPALPAGWGPAGRRDVDGPSTPSSGVDGPSTPAESANQDEPGARDESALPDLSAEPDATAHLATEVHQPPRRPRVQRGRRGAVLVAAGAVLAAAGAGAAAFLTSGPARSRPAAPVTVRDTSSPKGPVLTGRSPDPKIAPGRSCPFNYEATQAVAGDGQVVVCTYQSGSRYVWQPVTRKSPGAS